MGVEGEFWKFLRASSQHTTLLLILTRIAALVVYALFFNMFFHKYTLMDSYIEMEDCKTVEMIQRYTTRVVKMPSNPDFSPRNNEKHFRLKEYNMYEDTKIKDPEIDEIPVIFMPGIDDQPYDASFLAETLYNRTVTSKIRFRFYAIHAPGEALDNSGYRLLSLTIYLNHCTKFLKTQFKNSKVVVIGHSYGGMIAASMLHHPRITEYLDLLILQSAPLMKPVLQFDVHTGRVYNSVRTSWKNFGQQFTAGVVSYNGGLKDTSLDASLARLPSVRVVPAWTIHGCPDTGLKKQHMLVCAAFLDHISDLLIHYAKHHKELTGKEVVNSFYINQDNANTAGLPDEWKKEVLPENAITVKTGMDAYFPVLEQHWLDVKLIRDEYIDIKISGRCLSTATLIRDRRYFRRRDAVKNEADLNYEIRFMIFDASRFEDIRILLTSSSLNCMVHIETNCREDRFAHTFHKGASRDVQGRYLGTFMTVLYLIILEGDKRSVRYRKHLALYALVMFGVIYQSHHVNGTSLAGVLVGVGYALYCLLPVSAMDLWLVHWLGKRLDYNYTKIFKDYYPAILCFSCLCIPFLPEFGFYVALVNQFIQVKPSFAMIFLYNAAVSLGIFSRSRWYPDYTQIHYDPHHASVFVGLGLEFLLYKKKINVTRDEFINQVVVLFGVLILHSDWSLQYHFAIYYMILVMNRYLVKFVPKEMQKAPEEIMNLELLEQQYEELELIEEDEYEG